MISTLSHNDTVRAVMVGAAGRSGDFPPELSSYETTVPQLNIPIGDLDITYPIQEATRLVFNRELGVYEHHVAGWIVSALVLSLGSPIWLAILTRLGGVLFTGPPPPATGRGVSLLDESGLGAGGGKSGQT